MDPKFVIPMIISLVITIWAHLQYKSKGKMWGRPVAAIFAIICTLIAVFSLIYTSFFQASAVSNDMISKHHQYMQIAHSTFGKHVAEKQKGKRAILIYNKPSVTEMGKKSHDVSVEAFKKELMGSIEIVDTHEWVRADDNAAAQGMGMGMDKPFMTEDFEDIMSDFSDYDLIISFIGLPIDFKEMKYWKEEYDGEIPQFVLLNSSILESKPGITAGHFVSILHTKPVRFDFEAPIPNDPKEAFDIRYVIITPENVEAVHKEFPRLFRDEEK
ncbi:MAG: hypothetical protein HRT89_09560 [Lentisphaeria bacterium]|nr:hypothetical protein [Lentisphaeria bacterium]NQZ68307.1 hypothetical protein [Lentisphaeria bacterium]